MASLTAGRSLITVLVFLGGSILRGQSAQLRAAEYQDFPTLTDGNTPSFWHEGRLRIFTSIGRPLQVSEWDGERRTWTTQNVEVGALADLAIWAEAAWVDDDGVVFGWYHHEPGGMYPDSNLTAPKIGAFVSRDGGRSIQDLGFILVSGDPLDAEARNGAFTGGHGDFSVILDRERKYFYFLFTNYGGADDSQGVVVARMAFADRYAPAGRVYKFHGESWLEPGINGRVTPVFPAVRAWQHADPDSFWGPAVHWNTHLNQFVMLLNHAQHEGWSQEAIYVSFAKDLSQPWTWQKPQRLLGSSGFPRWGLFYPQVMGLEAGGTDTIAGALARFYLGGASVWEIEFTPPAVASEMPQGSDAQR